MEVKCFLIFPQKITNLKIKCLLKKLKKKLKIEKPIDVSKRGMFWEVDLDYPKKTHKLHKDFPLAPERYKVTYNEISSINQFLYNKMKKRNLQTTYGEEKLIQTFHERKQ